MKFLNARAAHKSDINKFEKKKIAGKKATPPHQPTHTHTNRDRGERKNGNKTSEKNLIIVIIFLSRAACRLEFVGLAAGWVIFTCAALNTIRKKRRLLNATQPTFKRWNTSKQTNKHNKQRHLEWGWYFRCDDDDEERRRWRRQWEGHHRGWVRMERFMRDIFMLIQFQQRTAQST